MKKVALVFVVAVLVPSLVLAWLAVRSLRDEQFLLERQQSLLYQRVTDALAANVSDHLSQQQQEFSAQVESLVASNDARTVAVQFDNQLRQHWPLAEVGFCVTLAGATTCTITCPSPAAGPEAQRFLVDNGAFLGNQVSAEVYWNGNNSNGGKIIAAGNNGSAGNQSSSFNNNNSSGQNVQQLPQQKISQQNGNSNSQGQNLYATKAQARAVNPQNQLLAQANQSAQQEDANFSKVIPAEAEFRQLIGDETDGMLARFLQNKLKLMFWHRLNRKPDLIFGAQLNLSRVVDGLRDLVQPEPALQNEICLALLDDNAKPVVISRAGFQANWKRPFVATEIGEALPHWEVAAYLVNPAALTRAVCIANLTIGLLIALLVLTIVIGSWLIVRNLNSELTLARQKTDFVSNVSHELKTPLTSIRMFSELLAEGRVTDSAKQKSYLNIITAEAARLTRLINNVLDFSRMESGEKKYNFQPCDLTEVVRAMAEIFRPHLEASGFKFDCELPAAPITVRADADALSQIIVNLLSNAEKYSDGKKEITLQLAQKQSPLPHAEIKVLDRGSGVPHGCEEKVFDKFYRAHDSLSSGIQGSGLGLTIARQIARAHGGDVVYEPREGGGSCFVLLIPVAANQCDGHRPPLQK
jgi:signal transduction histidine kinase